MLEQISDTLREDDYEVFDAASGEGALAQFAKVHPDLLILDTALPNMDGFQVCEQLRADPSGENLPILMLTGANDRESVKRAYDAGATDYFAKSTNLALLPHRVRYILRASQVYSELKESQARLSNAERIAHLGNWHLNIETGELQWSAEVYRIFGRLPSETVLTYDYFFSHVHPDDQELVQDAVGRALENGTPFRIEHRVLRADDSVGIVQQLGEVVLGEDGTAIGMDGTIQDVTAQKQAEEKVRNLAYFDPLTGLGNRQLFTERLAEAISQTKRRRSRLGVMFFDLDKFKAVNDTLGHATGDELLRQVGKRLRTCIRETDWIARNEGAELARLGGDEFTVILTDLEKSQDAAVVAERIREQLAEPFLIDGQEVGVSTSIGISIYPNDGQDANTLVTHADVAMYQSKTNGGNQYCYYTASMSEKIKARMDMIDRLRDAVENGYLSLRYQPIVALESGRLVGVEALVRWYDEKLGAVPPAEFIPLAEETGLIMGIGEWVLEQGCRQLVALEKKTGQQLSLSVNLSPFQFSRTDLVSAVFSVLEKTGLEPGNLQLEISEGLIMADIEGSGTVLQTLTEKGITVLVDDFGTGNTSLQGLARLPLNSLKVDRRFVQQIGQSQFHETLITTIIAMARALGLKVVAEGLESEAQLRFMRAQGCQLGQGYLLARPMAVRQLEELLQSGDPTLGSEEQPAATGIAR